MNLHLFLRFYLHLALFIFFNQYKCVIFPNVQRRNFLEELEAAFDHSNDALGSHHDFNE